MFEGKLGEKIFKQFLLTHKLNFEEDATSHTEADIYDFIMPNGATIDIKTRTKSFHIRTLEMVEQFKKNPKDIYVSVHLDVDNKQGVVVGWATKDDILRINRIENQGYLDNYVLYDKELRNVDELILLLQDYQ